MDFATMISLATKGAALLAQAQEGLDNAKGLTADQYDEVKAKLDEAHATSMAMSKRIDELATKAANP